MNAAERRNARRVLAVLTRLLDQKRDADFVRGIGSLTRAAGVVSRPDYSYRVPQPAVSNPPSTNPVSPPPPGRDTMSEAALLEDLASFAKLLEAEWYNGNVDEPAYLRLNADLSGVIAKHRQLTLDAARAASPGLATLDWTSVWSAWLAFNDEATRLGSGFTGQQVIGARAFMDWLRTHYLATLAASSEAAASPGDERLRRAAEWLVKVHADDVSIRGTALWEDLQALRAALDREAER